MLNTICTRKEKNTGIFTFWDLQNDINIIQFEEMLWCAGTAKVWTTNVSQDNTSHPAWQNQSKIN